MEILDLFYKSKNRIKYFGAQLGMAKLFTLNYDEKKKSLQIYFFGVKRHANKKQTF